MPQISSTWRCWADSATERARREASQAESWIIGPSRPIEAPLPTDSSADTLRTQVLRSFRSTSPARAAAR